MNRLDKIKKRLEEMAYLRGPDREWSLLAELEWLVAEVERLVGVIEGLHFHHKRAEADCRKCMGAYAKEDS